MLPQGRGGGDYCLGQLALVVVSNRYALLIWDFSGHVILNLAT